jgi:hypothetical protein
MIQCPECKDYAVEFDSYFLRPRCYSCGWLPSEFKSQAANGAFEPCDCCWGYSQLRGLDGQCNKCKNKGKILNSLGKEVVEIVQEMMEYNAKN